MAKSNAATTRTIGPARSPEDRNRGGGRPYTFGLLGDELDRVYLSGRPGMASPARRGMVPDLIAGHVRHSKAHILAGVCLVL